VVHANWIDQHCYSIVELVEMMQMSAGQKYRRTEFDDDDNASINDVTSPGVVYNPVIAFRAASLGGSGPGSRMCPRRTAVEKLLFIVVCSLVLVVFILAVLLAARSPSGESTTSSSSRDVTTTPSIGDLATSHVSAGHQTQGRQRERRQPRGNAIVATKAKIGRTTFIELDVRPPH